MSTDAVANEVLRQFYLQKLSKKKRKRQSQEVISTLPHRSSRKQKILSMPLREMMSKMILWRLAMAWRSGTTFGYWIHQWHKLPLSGTELHVRVDTQTTFGNLQCRQFNCSSCRCLYRIKYFVVVLFVIYPNIILQRQSYVFEFGYYYAHTSALSMIRHRVDTFWWICLKQFCREYESKF